MKNKGTEFRNLPPGKSTILVLTCKYINHLIDFSRCRHPVGLLRNIRAILWLTDVKKPIKKLIVRKNIVCSLVTY